MKSKEKWAAKGFTLIEIVAVLIIIGIVSAVAVARMMDTSQTDLISQVDVVKNHLRYAQARAMSTGRPWGVTFSSSTAYFLFDGAAPSTHVLFLGESNATVNLTAKGSKLTINSAPQTVTFDAYGSPGTTTITVSTNGGSITVTKNTGFIP
jgi:MSHA pilin protein MshC